MGWMPKEISRPRGSTTIADVQNTLKMISDWDDIQKEIGAEWSAGGNPLGDLRKMAESILKCDGIPTRRYAPLIIRSQSEADEARKILGPEIEIWINARNHNEQQQKD
jgi:hypothetical protein